MEQNNIGSSHNLINCKKCGALFIKTTRDICDNCYKHEMDLAEKVKEFIKSNEKIGKAKVGVEEILKATKISKKEFEDIFEKGRLFSVISKITVKCRFCSDEFECEKKAGFICQKCLLKLNDSKKSVKVNNSSNEAERRKKIARQKVAKGSGSRYGFIQNFDF